MFTVGEKYIITQNINGETVDNYNCYVLDYDENNGLLKVEHGRETKIINITSSSFIEATVQNNY